MQTAKVDGFDNLKVDDAKMNVWEGIIVPVRIQEYLMFYVQSGIK